VLLSQASGHPLHPQPRPLPPLSVGFLGGAAVEPPRALAASRAPRGRVSVSMSAQASTAVSLRLSCAEAGHSWGRARCSAAAGGSVRVFSRSRPPYSQTRTPRHPPRYGLRPASLPLNVHAKIHKGERHRVARDRTARAMQCIPPNCCRADPRGTRARSERAQQCGVSGGFSENSSARPRSVTAGRISTPSRRAQFPDIIVAGRKTQSRIRDTVSVVKSTVPIDFVPKSSEPVTSRPTGFNYHSQPDNFHRFQVTPPDRRILGCNKSSAN